MPFLFRRPSVFINCAMSADGKISTHLRRQVRISGPADIARVDFLRAESDAVMVGVGTVLADDPRLTVKSEIQRAGRRKRGDAENPLRVVVDSMARTPAGAKVLGPEGDRSCLIAASLSAPAERLSMLSKRCQIFVSGESRVDLPALMNHLHDLGVRRLMVEGGGTLIWSLLLAELVDEMYIYVGPMIIGGKSAPTPVDGDGFVEVPDGFPALDLISSETMDGGILLRWRVLGKERLFGRTV